MIPSPLSLVPCPQPLPQRALGVDIQRARKVVEHQQLGVAREHARGGGALDLPARKPHATRPDDSIQAIRHRGDILIQHGGMDRARKIDRLFRRA